jgi:hypothetical protein
LFTLHKNRGGNCAIVQNLNITVKKWVLLTNSPKKCAIIDSELKKDGDTMTKFDVKMTKTVLLLSKLRPMRGGR